MEPPLTADGRVRDPRVYREVTELVPISCIDALPTQGDLELELLLILRDRPEGGQGWALVGGGIYRGEELATALSRHLRATLGADLRWSEPEYHRPASIGEYFPDRRRGHGWDPRKHAIALTYILPVHGRPKPGGEARELAWFRPGDFPLPHEFGFGQQIVVGRLLSLLGGDWTKLADRWRTLGEDGAAIMER